MTYVRRYPKELPVLARLLPRITVPVTIINGRYDHFAVRGAQGSAKVQALPADARNGAPKGSFWLT